ncbi:hypothetical protein FOA52_011949 [Chlamydomonas sp. UWO 241]|nr:hypothetical protein FOA52_011949 [Chlamydomonas sp. UWO 241]
MPGLGRPAGAGGDAPLTAQLVRYGVLPKARRKELFGIECADHLEWRNWTAGTEYTKSYLLKNVSTDKTLQITYKQTASKSFSMDFPEPFKLRPGMSQALKVTFRPLKLQQYSDHIEIIANDASFVVLVEAYTPATAIEVARQLDFGYVPVRERVTRAITVRNTGDVPVSLAWTLDAPFGIEPRRADGVAPGACATFDVSFEPGEACSYGVAALCQLGGGAGASTTVRINGIGKFPYLSLEAPSVDFGTALVGKVVERTFRFGNHSPVDANFSVAHADGVEDGVFSVAPRSGTLGPDEYTLMRVTYTPRHTGTFSSESFSVSTAGGNRLALNLRGAAAGPAVSLSSSAFNFGNVPVGQAPSRVLYMRNDSDVPAVYDWQLDAEDEFAVRAPRGVIVPHSTGHVTVTFRSGAPANFWTRAVCLIKDADPLALDLLATSYSEKARPPPLSSRHVAGYMERLACGGQPVEVDPAAMSQAPTSVHSEGTMMTMAAAGRFADTPEEGATRGGATGALLGLADDGPHTGPLPGPVAWPLFFDGQDPAGALSLDTTHLDFGACSRLSASEYKAVTVTNRTTAKVTAFFSVPAWQDPTGGAPKPVFQVLPETADIKPGCQATFRVAFRPPRDAAHYAQTLQLRGHIKAMRNFRLVPDTLVVPPWTVPVTAVGNTFLHSAPEYGPRVELAHRRVAFPPCRPGERMFQTTMIINYGDTPAAFTFQTGALGSCFAVKPAAGVVPAKGSVLVGLQFTSTDDSPQAATTSLVFNGVAATAVPLQLSGHAFVPRLTFNAPGGALYFRPTCLGASSARALVVTNPSRVPVAFAFVLPARLQGIVSVSPAAGRLRGNESTTVTWSFAPARQRTLEARIACLLYDPDAAPPSGVADREDGGAGSSGGADLGGGGNGPDAALPPGVDRVYLRLVGEGTKGALAIEPTTLQLGSLRVGHAVTRTVTLTNQSDGVLRYRLEVGAADADGGLEDGATPVEFPQVGLSSVEPRPGEELWVDEPEGALPARASKTVTLTFYPRFRKPYALALRCLTATLPAAAPPPPGTRPASGGWDAAAAAAAPARKQLAPLPGGSAGKWALPALAAAGGGGSPDKASGGPAAAANGRGNEAGPELRPSAAQCVLSADCVFPRLRVSDVYVDGCPKHAAWDALGLGALNGELSTQVTDLEMDLSRLETSGALTPEAARAALTPYVLDFGCHAAGSRPVTITLELSNATALPVSWELGGADNTDLELENWVEPGRPANDADKLADFIVESKIFGISPRGGVLRAAGDAVSVVVTYSPRHVGAHDLPVFLRLRDGKRVQLALRGDTVSRPPQRLLLPPSQRTLTFLPTRLGEATPPLHTYLLRNGGPGPLSWELDLLGLDALAAQAWGHGVVALCTPCTGGVIPEGGAAALAWAFSPLQAITYSVDVPVRLGSGRVEVVTLTGRGVDPRHAVDDGVQQQAGQAATQALPGEGARDWAAWDGFSAAPSACPPGGRLATLSHDALSLGTLLPRGLTRRVLTLTNTCEYPVTFEWDLGLFAPAPPGAAHSGATIELGLTVSPRAGTLAVGESAVVRFVAEAGVSAQLFEAEVRVRVAVDEDAMFDATAAAVRESEATGPEPLDYTDTGSVIEEVIEESRERAGRAAAAARLRAGVSTRPRLPLHLYMTETVRGRIERLDTLHTTAMATLTRRLLGEGGIIAAPAMPEPQVVALAVCGRVLTREHVAAGDYIPAGELAGARALLEGTAWSAAPHAPFWAARSAAPAADAADAASSEACESAEAAPETAAEAEPQAGVAPAPEAVDGTGASDAPEEAARPDSRCDDVNAGGGSKDQSAGAAAAPAADAEADTPPAPPSKAAAAAAPVPVPPPEGEEAPRGEILAQWDPLPRPARVDAPPPRALSDAERARAVSGEVLRSLLAAAVDPTRLGAVVPAWRCLRPVAVPPFAALREAIPDAFGAAGGGSGGQPNACTGPAPVGAVVEATTSGGDAGTAVAVKGALLDREFQAFAEFVLESAVLGLVSESAAGEWDQDE